MMDWGVPDWRDAAAYPASGDALSLKQWWWQFTRRRPDYRELWQRLWPKLQTFVEANGDWCRVLADDERALKSEIETRWARVHLGAYAHELRTRFRLIGLPDPRIGDRDDDQLRHLLYAEDRACAVEYGSMDAVQKDQEDGFVLYRFNLNRPIPEQLEDAKEYLSDMQRDMKGKAIERRQRREKWPTYLRALDAHDAKAPLDTMAKEFWPGQNKTRKSSEDAYKAALRLGNNFPI